MARRKVTERRFIARRLGGNGLDQDRFVVEELRTYQDGGCQSFAVAYLLNEAEAQEIAAARNANRAV